MELVEEIRHDKESDDEDEDEDFDEDESPASNELFTLLEVYKVLIKNDKGKYV